MNQTPANILAALKTSVDGIVARVDEKLALYASGLEAMARVVKGQDTRVARLETLVLALLECKADQPLPALVSEEERRRRERIVRQFADLQTDVEARVGHGDVAQKRKESGG